MKVSTRQIAPGMIQQMQHPCPQCRGSGANRTNSCLICWLYSVLVYSKFGIHLTLVQESPSVREINALSAKVRRLHMKRKW